MSHAVHRSDVTTDDAKSVAVSDSLAMAVANAVFSELDNSLLTRVYCCSLKVRRFFRLRAMLLISYLC